VSFHNGLFGNLTVVKQTAPDIFLCQCSCGTQLEVWRSLLTGSIQRNCGMCVTRGKISSHGHTRSYKTRDGRKLARHSREYYSWSTMIARCTSEKHHAYADYGGRGICVCERWLPDGTGRGFKNFLHDMGPRPSGMTLDRKNPQGHYEPTNCQWADKDTQAQNRRPQLWPDGNVPPVQDYLSMERELDEAFAVPY
jgi:hypothetical protein